MASSPDSRDSEVLVEAIEKILRQITRMVVGRLGFPKYLSLMRKIFVEEAEKVLQDENESGKISMTDLGLLTGIDTRTLAKIRKSDEYNQPIAASKAFFTDLTPEAAVVDKWSSDPDYLDQESGEPISLPISGEEKSFELLVQSVVKSRGITVQSILNRLSQKNSVSFINRNQTVILHPDIWFSYEKTDAASIMQSALFGVFQHLVTVQNNIQSVSEPIEPLFERMFWSNRINPSALDDFRTSMEGVLEKSCSEVFEAIKLFEHDFNSENTVSGGVGFYYFDSEVP